MSMLQGLYTASSEVHAASARSSLLAIATGIVFCVTGSSALGQVNWTSDEAAALKQAKTQDRPLIIHFSADEGKKWQGGRGGDYRNKGNRVDMAREAVRKAFRDPRVAKLAAHCVPVFADIKDKRNSEIRKKLGGQIRGNDVVFATPDLEKLEEINAGQMNADAAFEVLERALAKWTAKLYARDVRPVLQDEEAPPAKLRAALQRLAEIVQVAPAGADQDVIALLGRDRLDGGVRGLAFDVLAKLSTEPAVHELMRQAEKYAPADKALRKCTRRSLKVLLTYLKDEQSHEFLRAYKTIAAITDARAQPDEFWKNASVEQRAAEINRIRTIAEKKMA